MIYGLLAVALILSLPACGMFRKNSEQPAPETTSQVTESMPVEVEEVEVTEAPVTEDVAAAAAEATTSDQEAA